MVAISLLPFLPPNLPSGFLVGVVTKGAGPPEVEVAGLSAGGGAAAVGEGVLAVSRIGGAEAGLPPPGVSSGGEVWLLAGEVTSWSWGFKLA
jgi:hypothetical protein